MSHLVQRVTIDRRFARSARIDTDLNGTPPLVGYVMQASIAKALDLLACSQIENHQGAFTWTGPYGGGKSSAALLLANLVAGSKTNRAIAAGIAGAELTELYAAAFPQTTGPWKVAAVTGSRVRLRDAILEAGRMSFGWTDAEVDVFSMNDEQFITGLIEGGKEATSGTLLILDELGKLLEHEAIEGGDVHLLQDLAEHASRSKGRLVVIGILHQSFDQYAARAARGARSEWAKVQGRYQDISFLSGADETVALLGRAIQAEAPADALPLAQKVAEAVAKRRPTESALLAKALVETWPLNPVTALLLGPISRARFAQNERSVFGFLSSAEPYGFQEFLETREAHGNSTYIPSLLWDYLAANFGMALAAGADGSRFSLAFEAVERASAKGGALHVALTKTAAIIEFFRNGSGVALSDDFLVAALPDEDPDDLATALQDLLSWAVLMRQPRLSGYALFAGSDFDLDEAIGRAILPVDTTQLDGMAQRVGFGFAAAKRHYFLTGALRTFEIALQIISDKDDSSSVTARILGRPQRGSGLLLLLLGDGSLSSKNVENIAKHVARDLKAQGRAIAVGGAADSFNLRSSAGELLAVERVFREHPQLEGDRIARREIAARQSQCIDDLHRALETALEAGKWYLAPAPGKSHSGSLAMIASLLADAGYSQTPVLRSELLQRDKLSSNSMAALRELCHAMVQRPAEPQLGITQYPAELGLYLTILKPFGLHRRLANGLYGFTEPDESQQGLSLRPAWSIIEDAANDSLADVFERWAAPPYGLKAGVMPVIALAYILAKRENIAVYIDGIFQPSIDDIVVDKLLQKPALFRLRRVDRSVREAAFLSELAQKLGLNGDSASLPVAAALFQHFEAFSQYAKRTSRISVDAQRIRAVILKSEDPEKLLFDDLPDALGSELSADAIVAAMAETEQCYPALLDEMRLALARALGVDAASFDGVSARVAVIKGLTNDYNFDAFADRAAALELGQGDVESMLSLLLHRPARNWSDRDREEALTEIARYGRRFRELEALAVVRDRKTNTEALALVVGLDPNIPPLMRSFVLSDNEKTAAAGLADQIVATLRNNNEGGRLRLAALARAVAVIAADTEAELEAL